MKGRQPHVVVLAVGLALAAVGGASAAPSADRILSVDRHTSDKGRHLAATHGPALRDLSAKVYHCMPWVEVAKESIGFFKPKHLSQDDRYLSIRIYIDQDPSPAFASMAMSERASAMFSRYVGPLLRRMASNPTLIADPTLDGFTVVLEWMKQIPKGAGDRPVHETIAVFVDRPTARQYLGGQLRADALAGKTRVMGWDGETALGPLRVNAWEDNFVATYKVKNYRLEPGVTCQ